ASPEGKPFSRGEYEISWARFLTETLIDALEIPLSELTPEQLHSLLADDVAVEAALEADDAAYVIAELRAFFRFLQREYMLANAAAGLAILGDAAIDKLRVDATAAEERIGNEVPFPGGLASLLTPAESEDQPEKLDITEDELAELAFELAET